MRARLHSSWLATAGSKHTSQLQRVPRTGLLTTCLGEKQARKVQLGDLGFDLAASSQLPPGSYFLLYNVLT